MMLDPLLITEILEASLMKPPFASTEEETICRDMVNELSLEDQETAAQTSYAYSCWVNSSCSSSSSSSTSSSSLPLSLTSPHQSDSDTCDDVRIRMAMREARRHLVGEEGNYQRALYNLQQTCRFRREYKLNILRSCFQRNGVEGDDDDDDDDDSDRFRKLLRNDLEKQVMVIRGHDREHRAILVKLGRTTSEIDHQAYTLSQIYMVERALACSEVLSKGQQEDLVAVFDFGSYLSANSPPTQLVRHTVRLIQQSYPERLHQLIILDPPLWMRALYSLISPFLAPKTRAKVILASGDSHKEALLASLVDVDQAMPFMLPHGKLTSPIDLPHFLHHVPFHSLYDQDQG